MLNGHIVMLRVADGVMLRQPHANVITQAQDSRSTLPDTSTALLRNAFWHGFQAPFRGFSTKDTGPVQHGSFRELWRLRSASETVEFMPRHAVSF